MTAKEAAAMIDISAVRTQHNYGDILEVVEYARQYRFVNVHVLPNWVKKLAELLKDVDGVYVGAPVGFPSGGHCTETKLNEAKCLLNDGVQEMDIMMNVGRFCDGQYEYVKKELEEIIHMAKGRALTKVILEINTLTNGEMLRASDIAMAAGADFVKTGTGWVPGDANIDRIRLLKQHCGDRIKVKAAGGIRTREEFLALVDMGIERVGINTKSALEIVGSFE